MIIRIDPVSSRGFTLVEMIIVIVVTGIIGGIVALFLRAPIQQYTDVARRADMSDIADTALRRIVRDLRLALPNSVRVAGACDGAATCFVEFLPTIAGGRYRAKAGGDELNFAAVDTSFEVLGPMPSLVSAEAVVVYNLGIPGSDAYDSSSRTTTAVSAGVNAVNIAAPGKQFPFESPGQRFHVIARPVTYACDGAGTLWRYWGYAIQDVQTKTDSIAELDALVAVQGARARLATHVGRCLFSYEPLVVGRSGLVTMHLAITEGGETVTLYSAAHVSNQP